MLRDFCNTCGAKRGGTHAERCHLTGLVVAWSGVIFEDEHPADEGRDMENHFDFLED